MDPLSDVLRAVRLTGAYFFLVEASRPWSIKTPPALSYTQRVLPEAEHLIAYHVLTEGECWVGLEGESPVLMQPGDIVVLPHGHAHRLSSDHEPRGELRHMGNAPLPFPTLKRMNEGPCDNRFVCGFLGCDARPFNPLIGALPSLLHLKATGDGWLAAFPEQAARESRNARAGSDEVLTRMAELMFVEVVRRHLESLRGTGTGWLAGLSDPLVGAALAKLHEDPARHWTLVDLAKEVASSRSVLAERFTHVVGIPPMQYLAKWRLQRAAELLARGGEKVSAVGAQVGYESEAAFSRAFKRATGVSPAAWRKSRRAG